MEIHLKIKDVVGMDEDKRHVFLVDNEEFKKAILEHEGFLLQEVLKEYFLKHKTKLLTDIINDNDLRNTIYMQEKAKREKKAVERVKTKQAQIDKQRRREAFTASANYRKSVDYIHNVLGWNND